MLKIKHYLFICLMGFSAFVFAAEPQKTFDIDFRQVAIPEFSNAVLKGMLQRDYVLSSDVLNDTRKVTVNVKSINSDKVLTVFSDLLKGLNVSVVEKQGVIFVERVEVKEGALQGFDNLPKNTNPQAVDSETETKHLKLAILRHYIPKNRSVTFLAKIAKFTGAQIAETDDLSSVLVYSSDDEMVLQKTLDMLLLVDKPEEAITIKAALIEYSNSHDSSRSLSAAVSLLSAKLGVVYSAGQSLVNGITYRGKTLSAAISAIDGDSSFNYLAEPTIRVLNGQKAKLVVGSEVPVRGSSTVDKNGNIIQSVDYKTAGVQFDVMPKINTHSITLHINQQISNFGLTTTSSIDSPTLFKRQAETTLDVKKGSLIIMAGLDENKKVDTSSGLFFLPNFLKSKTKNESKSQILLLLEIVDDEKVLL